MEFEEPYVVLRPHSWGCTAYIHVAYGRGRARRRRLVLTLHTPLALTPDTLPDVLEDVARQTRLPAGERWAPLPQGLGSPVGRWGAS